jgi:hypothetical protein
LYGPDGRAPCRDRPGGEHPRNPAASAFTAVAKNQSQELRSQRENQTQPRPPESGGFTPPSTGVSEETLFPDLDGFARDFMMEHKRLARREIGPDAE